VAVVPISIKLQEQGSILFDIGTGPLHRFSHHEHVLSIDRDAGNQIATLVELIVVGGSLLGSTHTIVVIFANVDHGQLPKTSHIGSLHELALVCSTITVHRARKCILTLVLHSERKTCAHWHLSTDNTVATVEALLAVVVVHRAALSL